MASRSMYLALCFFAFCGQIRNAAAYRTQLPVVLHCELQATGSKYPKRHAHRSEHSINPKEDVNERLGGQAIAPWGRAAHVSWSPHKPQPARSTTTCCARLLHSTSSSSGNTHATWSGCAWARANCLQLQKSSDRWMGQRIEEAKLLLLTYFAFSIPTINSDKKYLSNFSLSTSDYCLIQGGRRTTSNPNMRLVLFCRGLWEAEHSESLSP